MSEHIQSVPAVVPPMPTGRRPDYDYVRPNMASADMPTEVLQHTSLQALQQFENSLPGHGNPLEPLRPMFAALAMGNTAAISLGGGTPIMFDGAQAREALHKAAAPEQAYARVWRDTPRYYQTNAPGAQPNSSRGRLLEIDAVELAKANPMAKAVLDVGTQTNFTQITGGQSLGYVSLDTRLARGTVRPDSFTFYQSLPKSPAYQVVDYFAYIDDPGGALPGSATSGFSNVSSGTLATNAGIYTLQSINLKLMLDGRAVTLALMAQNNFVSVNEQENANSALTVLQTADWMCFHGNPNIFPNQFAGVGPTTPSGNLFDFQQFVAANLGQGWSTAQALYNMLYEVAANIASWTKFGRSTHAFMTPTTNGSLQSLVTTLLNNLVNSQFSDRAGIVVDGDLQGMRTRLGPIQFPLDIIITARDTPAQGQPRSNGTTPTTTVNPTPPSGVIASASGAAYAGSNWGVGAGSPYTGSTASYHWGVASTDVNMNESNLAWSNALAGSAITTSGAAVVAIGGPAAADAYAYRVFRTGAGGFASGSNSPTAVRYVGSILASGTGTVNFIDYNYQLPGSEEIYLLDMRTEDEALDYRYLLPLTRINLFAANLYMPWCVASIGAIRNRIPKMHAVIRNFVPDNPAWNPLGANN
jgi:hypothetical protein